MSARSEQSAPAPSRGARSIGIAVAVGGGMAVATQARINGELSQRIGDGLLAALLSFLGGLLLLGLVAATQRRMRRGLGRVHAAVREGRLRPTQLLGGLCGAFLVLSQGLRVVAIGVAVFPVAGQTASARLVDLVAPSGAGQLTASTLIGTALTLVAVTVTAAPGRYRPG